MDVHSLRQLLLQQTKTIRLRLRQVPSRAGRARNVTTGTEAGAAPTAASADAATLPKQSRFRRALSEMKRKPGTHVTSFLFLHELTAVLPLFPLYYFFQWSNMAPAFLGGPLVGTVASYTIPSALPSSLGGGQTVSAFASEWIDSLARTVARVGTRYGILGFKKIQQLRGKEKDLVEEEGSTALRRGMRGMGEGVRSRVAENVSGVSVRNVMDAVAAYAVVKAFLPVRLAISISATPWFATRILGPSLSAIRRGGSKAKSSVTTSS